MTANQQITELVSQIIAFNHCWKLAQSRFGVDSAIACMLRDKKSVLQSSLLRQGLAYLKIDPEVTGEPLFSVRLYSILTVNGFQRIDAEHLPVRLAEELFTFEELRELINE